MPPRPFNRKPRDVQVRLVLVFPLNRANEAQVGANLWTSARMASMAFARFDGSNARA